MRTTIEDVDDHFGHAETILADRSSEKLTHFELRPFPSLPRLRRREGTGQLVRTDENDTHLPALRLLGRTKPRREAVAVDTQEMKAVGIAIGTARDRHAPMIVGTAPPGA